MKKAFTLVEIMIVVAIIALLAAIAIPNLLRARLTANESSAIATLRTLSSCAENFRAAQTSPTYPANLTALTTAAPPYVSGFTGADGNQKAGYTFAVAGAQNMYQAVANPITVGTTGNRSFCVDHTGVLRAQNSAYTAVSTGVCAGSVIE